MTDFPARRAAGTPIRIGLLWHSATSGNLGVGALTVANMAIARDVAEAAGLAPSFTVLGMRDLARPAMLGDDVTVVAIDWRALLSPSGFRRAIAGLDVVLDIGMGDSFADIYGAKRFLMLWLAKMHVLARGIPLILSPQTIGPFERPRHRLLAAMALRRARRVFARDQRSLEFARDVAPDAPLALSTDVAFELPFTPPPPRTGDRLRIGVNVSGLLFSEAESGGNRFGLSYDYARFTRALLTDLTARADCDVHLVPHVIEPRLADDDSRLADRLHAEFPATIRLPDFTTPSEAKSAIATLDLLIAARMHACIGAFSSGTPVLPVAYSRKFAGLFGSLGYDRQIPVTGLDDTGALAMALAAVDQRDLLAAEQAEAMGRVTALLAPYRAALDETFRADARA